jgi:hypothetical protein
MSLDTASTSDDFDTPVVWADQSNELARWVAPLFIAAVGVAVAFMFGLGLGSDADNPIALTVLGWAGVVWTLGWIAYTATGGPTRVEVDQRSRTIRSIELRRIGARTRTWRFDDITTMSVSATIEFLRDKDGNRTENPTHYVVLHLANGERVRLFGKYFKGASVAKYAHERMNKMLELTGKQAVPVDPKAFDELRKTVEAKLVKLP